MARVLFIWEAGADYGHLMRLATLGRELARRGHAPVFALRDLTHVQALLGDLPGTVLQAPLWRGVVSGLPPPAGPAETLLRIGFLHPQALAGMVRAWRSLLDLVQPDLLVLDFAPTAMLATRGLPLPRLLLGDTFALPPRRTPLPPYRWWRPESALRMAESERHALEGANTVLAQYGQPPLARLADLYEADEAIATAWEAFDQYPGRDAATERLHYWGALPGLDTGVAPDWPKVDGRRVFAYLKPHARDFDAVLSALKDLPVSVAVHAPGLSVAAQRRHLAANLRFHAQPLRMADVLRDVTLGICHAGANTTQALVAAGIPALLLPEHVEQMMTARRAAELGAALVVDHEKPPPHFKRLIQRLLDEPAFTDAARAVQARHAGDDPTLRAARIVDRLLQWLPGGGALATTAG
jgi:UDP:flavonoid glycosyltransferase YjiC (YdhE family)